MKMKTDIGHRYGVSESFKGNVTLKFGAETQFVRMCVHGLMSVCVSVCLPVCSS